MDMNGSEGIFSVCIPGKMCAVLDKAVAIHEILDVRMSLGWLVKSGQLENTSSIISKQSCSGGPELTHYRVAGFRVFTTSNQTHRFSHNML
jgi:hypothetical protein